MNEILSKTREIEENPFFFTARQSAVPAIFEKYWELLLTIFDVKKMSISNAHLYGKNEEKLMMKSRENAKKPVFPAYFRHFRPEKYVFQKSGSVTF